MELEGRRVIFLADSDVRELLKKSSPETIDGLINAAIRQSLVNEKIDMRLSLAESKIRRLDKVVNRLSGRNLDDSEDAFGGR